MVADSGSTDLENPLFPIEPPTDSMTLEAGTISHYFSIPPLPCAFDIFPGNASSCCAIQRVGCNPPGYAAHRPHFFYAIPLLSEAMRTAPWRKPDRLAKDSIARSLILPPFPRVWPTLPGQPPAESFFF